MSLIIDGYNLLYAAGIVGAKTGPGGLERSRAALLGFLAELLDPREAARTTVVFDAKNPPPGLPRSVEYRGMTVCFASAYEDADSLIEELVRADSAPRRLTVVSSDHRLQRAARRRGAQAVDSDVWYDQACRQRYQRQHGPVPAQGSARPTVPLLEEDVEYWIRQFGGQQALDDLLKNNTQSDTYNPFPPGYGEDVGKDEG